MLNIFSTPERKVFAFRIPETAKIDKQGFYIIDKEFKDFNPHIDFNYLAHDLEYRGLSYENTFYDRKDCQRIGLYFDTNNGLLHLPPAHKRSELEHLQRIDTARRSYNFAGDNLVKIKVLEHLLKEAHA